MIFEKSINRQKVFFQVRGIEHNPPHIHIALSKKALYKKDAVNIIVNLKTLKKTNDNTSLGKIENDITFYLAIVR